MDSPATESSSQRQAFKLLGDKILYCFVIFTRNILIDVNNLIRPSVEPITLQL